MGKPLMKPIATIIITRARRTQTIIVFTVFTPDSYSLFLNLPKNQYTRLTQGINIVATVNEISPKRYIFKIFSRSNVGLNPHSFTVKVKLQIEPAIQRTILQTK